MYSAENLAGYQLSYLFNYVVRNPTNTYDTLENAQEMKDRLQEYGNHIQDIKIWAVYKVEIFNG